jgi:hypothetical protein
MNSTQSSGFVETLEHRRFAEFVMRAADIGISDCVTVNRVLQNAFRSALQSMGLFR